MRKKGLIFLSVIPFLFVPANFSLYSCATQDKTFDTFKITTNFNEKVATLLNNTATVGKDFETIICLKKDLDVQDLTITVGEKILSVNKDYYITYNLDTIDLVVYGRSINEKNLNVRLNVTSFEVNFSASDNQAWISNKNVFLNQDFNTLIHIDENQNFESIIVETNSKQLINGVDFTLVHDEKNNILELSILSSSISEIYLNISVTLSKKKFEVKLLSPGHSNILSLSNTTAFIKEDYSTIIHIQSLSLVFADVQIYNGNSVLKKDVDFTIQYLDDNAFVNIKGDCIIQNSLSIIVKLQPINYQCIKNNLLNMVPEQVPEAYGNKMCLYGIEDGAELKDYDCLKIPDCIYEIKPNAFEKTFDWSSKKNTNIENIFLSNFSQLRNIDKAAFKGCNALLSSITFPENLVNIGEEAFNGCNISGNLIFPKSLRYIGKNAFSECTRLSGTLSFTKNDNPSYPEIGENAFLDCIGIHTIDLTSYDTFIPNWAKPDMGANDIFKNFSDSGIVYIHNTDPSDWIGLKSRCHLPELWEIRRI